MECKKERGEDRGKVDTGVGKHGEGAWGRIMS